MLSIGEIRLIPCSGSKHYPTSSFQPSIMTTPKAQVKSLVNFEMESSKKKKTPKLGVQNQVANYWYGNWKPQRKLWAALVGGGAELWLNNSSHTHCLWWNKDNLQPHAWSFIWNSEKASHHDIRFWCSTSIDCRWKWQHGILLEHTNSILAFFSSASRGFLHKDLQMYPCRGPAISPAHHALLQVLLWTPQLILSGCIRKACCDASLRWNA